MSTPLIGEYNGDRSDCAPKISCIVIVAEYPGSVGVVFLLCRLTIVLGRLLDAILIAKSQA